MRLGGIASGDSFFGRQAEQKRFWQYIQEDNVLLSGPRRLGKSSLINRLCEGAAELGWLSQMVDVQDCDSALGFVTRLHQAFPEQAIAEHLTALSQQIKTLVKTVKKIEVMGVALELQDSTTPQWQKLGQQLQERLQFAPVLIFIDEFSVFLERLIAKDKAEAQSLVAWLCAWRKQPNIVSRFLFTGSICLNTLLEKHQLHTYFNDCHDMTLGPFSNDAAEAMLIEFAQRKNWELKPIAAKRLMAKVGWLSPYMLNKLLDEVMSAAEDRLSETKEASLPRMIHDDDIEAAYERLLGRNSIFIHWQKRLERDLTEPDLSFTKALLTALSKASMQDGLTTAQLSGRLAKREPDADKRADLLQRTLSKLADDGYLSVPNKDKKVHFLSFVLCEWWKRNHV